MAASGRSGRGTGRPDEPADAPQLVEKAARSVARGLKGAVFESSRETTRKSRRSGRGTRDR